MRISFNSFDAHCTHYPHGRRRLRRYSNPPSRNPLPRAHPGAKLRLRKVSSYFYPDVMVTCEARLLDLADALVVEEPVLVIEVLSPTSPISTPTLLSHATPLTSKPSITCVHPR